MQPPAGIVAFYTHGLKNGLELLIRVKYVLFCVEPGRLRTVGMLQAKFFFKDNTLNELFFSSQIKTMLKKHTILKVAAVTLGFIAASTPVRARTTGPTKELAIRFINFFTSS
jgi:hypothetical protein